MLRWVFVDTHYQIFLDAYYRRLKKRPKTYDALRQRLFQEHFGTADYYSKNLRHLGDEAQDLVINDLVLQRQWLSDNWKSSLSTAYLFLSDILSKQSSALNQLTAYRIFLAQVQGLRPDIVYIKNVNHVPPEWLAEVKRHTKLIVGQVAYKVGNQSWLRAYDLLISSLPNLITKFRKLGMHAELVKIGFDPSVLDVLRRRGKKYDVVFIGGFTEVHDAGNKVVEAIAREIPVDVWGYKEERLAKASPLLQRFHGVVWGREMLEVFYNSKIVLNRHSSVAGNFANNMRLYEATGVGSLLMTDKKKNIGDLFVPGKEVVVYESAQDAIQKIRYYLSHESERRRIAKAGQKRTLRDHTYATRMKQLKEILNKYLKPKTVPH